MTTIRSLPLLLPSVLVGLLARFRADFLNSSFLLLALVLRRLGARAAVFLRRGDPFYALLARVVRRVAFLVRETPLLELRCVFLRGLVVLTRADTSSSLRIECQPRIPFRLAMSARSFLG